MPDFGYDMAVVVVVATANVLGAAMTAPQALRLRRTRQTDGVSMIWAGVGVAMNLWWILYGTANHVWAVLPVSVVAIVLYSVIARVMWVEGGVGAARDLALGAFGLGVVPLPFLVGSGWELAGVALGACYGLQFMPAVISAYRSEAAAGISALTWKLAWIEAAMWLLYGLVELGDPALGVGGAAGLFMSSLILIRLGIVERRGPLSPLHPALG